MIKEFSNLEEIEKYYNKETNTYVFKEDGEWIDLVVLNFNLCVNATINACNINACDISANNISANNINANNISYYAVCFAYENIVCDSIKGRRENSKHFVLDGKLTIINQQINQNKGAIRK